MALAKPVRSYGIFAQMSRHYPCFSIMHYKRLKLIGRTFDNRLIAFYKTIDIHTIISLVQNDTDQALSDANQAVTLSPDSTAARIALSYAQQNFDSTEIAAQHNNMGISYFLMGHYEKSLDHRYIRSGLFERHWVGYPGFA